MKLRFDHPPRRDGLYSAEVLVGGESFAVDRNAGVTDVPDGIGDYLMSTGYWVTITKPDVPAVPTQTAINEASLRAMEKHLLVDMTDEMGIDIDGRLSKDKIIDAILAHVQSQG